MFGLCEVTTGVKVRRKVEDVDWDARYPDEIVLAARNPEVGRSRSALKTKRISDH
jgi:hypothetical protein